MPSRARHVSPWCLILALFIVPWMVSRAGGDSGRFETEDVFQLEYASDPRVSPDGRRIVYVRNFMDIMKDVRRSNLWIVDVAGGNHRPLTSGNRNDGSPRWSPDGNRLLYVSNTAGSLLS